MNSETALDVTQIGLALLTLFALFLKLGPAKRARKRDEIAAMAIDYAEQMGGTAETKLRHAVGAAQRIDAADNGKRDYNDAELRIAIEAALGRRNKGASP